MIQGCSFLKIWGETEISKWFYGAIGPFENVMTAMIISPEKTHVYRIMDIILNDWWTP